MDDLLDTVVVGCIVMMFLSVVFLCAWMYPPLHGVKKVDCSIVEFSPDYSAEIKQLCREARNK